MRPCFLLLEACRRVTPPFKGAFHYTRHQKRFYWGWSQVGEVSWQGLTTGCRQDWPQTVTSSWDLGCVYCFLVSYSEDWNKGQHRFAKVVKWLYSKQKKEERFGLGVHCQDWAYEWGYSVVLGCCCWLRFLAMVSKGRRGWLLRSIVFVLYFDW